MVATLGEALCTLIAMSSYFTTVQASREAIAMVIEPYFTSDCSAVNSFEERVLTYEPDCLSFKEPFGGFRHTWYSSDPIYPEHLEDFGSCIIEVWASPGCKADYIGQVQGASRERNQGTCSRVAESGFKGRSLTTLCRPIEGDLHQKGLPIPDTKYLFFEEEHASGTAIVTAIVKPSESPLPPPKWEKRPSVDIPDGP